jgi:hypothetical protein
MPIIYQVKGRTNLTIGRRFESQVESDPGSALRFHSTWRPSRKSQWTHLAILAHKLVNGSKSSQSLGLFDRFELWYPSSVQDLCDRVGVSRSAGHDASVVELESPRA